MDVQFELCNGGNLFGFDNYNANSKSARKIFGDDAIRNISVEYQCIGNLFCHEFAGNIACNEAQRIHWNKERNDNMIKIENLSKTIDKKVILKDITMSFEKGKIYGIVGRNGCGKTMLLRAICGYVKSVTINIVFQLSLKKF